MQLKPHQLVATVCSVTNGFALPSLFHRQTAKCMDAAETEEIVEIYCRLITKYTEPFGEKYVVKDFVDINDLSTRSSTRC